MSKFNRAVAVINEIKGVIQSLRTRTMLTLNASPDFKMEYLKKITEPIFEAKWVL